jgi:hypothetical protein
VNGDEHRDIGDAASGGAMVNLGGEAGEERFWLSFGDVMALSGDYFTPDPWPRSGDGGRAAGTLFALARIPGKRGTRPQTRDEIVCALKVMTIDEDVVDPRFEPGGRFADFRFGRRGAPGEVERRVRDRYLVLAATNDDHFAAPGGVTHPRLRGCSTPLRSAALAYRHLHQVAVEEASRLGCARGDLPRAMAREAAAQHFLTDAFTAGHMRTPVARIRRVWHARYPAFWESLQHMVGSATAATLREQSWALRRLPVRDLHDATLAALRRRTSRYPELSVGDFLARLFHDWDNSHGLRIGGGGVVFGDGYVDHGLTRPLALAAARAGIDDIEAAYELGASGRRLTGESLYRRVRAVTGAPDGAFRAETMIPRPSAANPSQNWWATDIETLWDTPIVGNGGTTVGEALAEMMQPDGYFIRQLDCLGQGLVEAHGLLAVPVVGTWLAREACRAYHRGFVDALAAQPRQTILSVVHADTGIAVTGRAARRPRPSAPVGPKTPASGAANSAWRDLGRAPARAADPCSPAASRSPAPTRTDWSERR